MRSGSRPEAWAVLLALAAATPARAQGWRETQFFGAALASKPAVALAGIGFASRDASRTRLGIALAGGIAEGNHAAGRLEATWHFLLDPVKRSGMAVYGGGGLALSVIASDKVRPYAQAVLGIESRPAGRHGVFIEAGFGGGARFALGIRTRTRKIVSRP